MRVMRFCFLLFFSAILSAAETKSWPSGDDLTVDLIVNQPEMAQPIFLNFDHRGRMWVAQYRQYPFPAGSKVVGKDRFWRSEYDRIPQAPGHPDYVAGKDRITIHEDRNGDGTFDKTSTFLDGLSFCTSFAHDSKGLWVLQPPYLLFYEDKDRDDTPDGPPKVHLRGFGIEDSHSLSNSLCWGPDGWLYGANGSTTSLRVTVEGKSDPPVAREGQLIWRYHPTRRVFEIFAEGGGNNLSCEFDSVGRLYSGSNTGDAAFYYHQGAYYQKTFGKHGALSNPNTYGYLAGIAHQKYSRVTNSVIIYEGGGLPDRFNGAMVFANPLTLGVGSYRPEMSGLNFKVTPNGIVEVRKDDPWFCPVYLDAGPDGALYVCDWYDQQCNHLRHSEGNLSADDGRIFRIRARQSEPQKPFDLSKASVFELLEHLKSDKRWWREQAREMLRNHPDRELARQTYERWISHEKGQLALEGLWGWNLMDDLSLPVFRMAMGSENPHVRRWAIRLAADEKTLSQGHLKILLDLLMTETDLEVLAQVASSAARLPHAAAHLLIASLVKNDALSKSPDLQLLTWWALERHCLTDPFETVKIVNGGKVAAPFLLSRVLRRWAQESTKTTLHACARLLRDARGFDEKEGDFLWAQFNAAFEGRPLPKLPEPLLKVLMARADLPFYLQLRLPGEFPKVRVKALAILKGEGGKSERESLLRIIEFFGEEPTSESTPVLIKLLSSKDAEVVEQVLGSLQGIDSDEVGKAVLAQMTSFPVELRKAAEVLLLSRASWTSQWLKLAAGNDGLKNLLGDSLRARIAGNGHAEHLPMLAQLFPETSNPRHPVEKEVARLRTLLAQKGKADVEAGYRHFSTRCATCHVLHGQGGEIGPMLTSYQRDDLKTLLPAIVNPAVEIREGFETYTLKTRDGRTLTGFLKSKDVRNVVLQPAGGNPVSIAADHLLSLEPAGISLMPPGLLTGMTEQDLIDFFAYLRSTQPLNHRRK